MNAKTVCAPEMIDGVLTCSMCHQPMEPLFNGGDDEHLPGCRWLIVRNLLKENRVVD